MITTAWMNRSSLNVILQKQGASFVTKKATNYTNNSAEPYYTAEEEISL
jgi:hypothetical protein